MSIYKHLAIENQELREPLTLLSIAIQGLKDSLEDIPEWVSIDELQLQLSAIPILLPF